MISDKSRQQLQNWWLLGKQQLSQVFSQTKQIDVSDLIGMVISPQHLKLLKIKRLSDQYEVEYFNAIDLPEGLVASNEIKDCAAVANILRNIFNLSGLSSKNIVLAIPRSSAIIKTITVDKRLLADEIESRVWLEANRLFPNLIGEIYLDFAVNGLSEQDPSQVEVLVVACRKDLLKSYLDTMRMADLEVKVVDINYYAYERTLSLMSKQFSQLKTIALLSITFNLIDLLVMQDNKIVYTHELSYDGHGLSKLIEDIKANKADINVEQVEQMALADAKTFDVLKNTVGLHLKHAMQFFYSSRPNTRVERIILSGHAAIIPGMLEFVGQEIGKEVSLAEPFLGMKMTENIDQTKLMHYAPALVLCCGLALTKLI